MKRSVLFAVLLLAASLGSCQCAEEPDVGPVEGDESSAQSTLVETPRPGPIA